MTGFCKFRTSMNPCANRERFWECKKELSLGTMRRNFVRSVPYKRISSSNLSTIFIVLLHKIHSQAPVSFDFSKYLAILKEIIFVEVFSNFACFCWPAKNKVAYFHLTSCRWTQLINGSLYFTKTFRCRCDASFRAKGQGLFVKGCSTTGNKSTTLTSHDIIFCFSSHSERKANCWFC